VPTRHILTIDVEEYFQVEAATRAGVDPREWDGFPKRLGPAVDRLLALLDRHGATATFFVLGWVARHEPEVVRRIVAAGHPVASHGTDHRMLHHLDPEALARDLAESRRRLEDLTGRPVLGYRAPTFSLNHATAWAIDVLAEAGFRYDSSVFPIRHDRYGVPDAPLEPHRAVGPAGGTVLEVPPLAVRVLGRNWPVGGGGYLRLLPRRAVAWGIRAAERRARPALIYVHPWEVDPDQPLLPLSPLGRFRHRVGLSRTEAKLDWLLARFRFTSVEAVLASLEAQAARTFGYGRSGG